MSQNGQSGPPVTYQQVGPIGRGALLGMAIGGGIGIAMGGILLWMAVGAAVGALVAYLRKQDG